MTVVSLQGAGAAGVISRRWFQAHSNNWLVALDLARVHGLQLLDLVGGSYRELRDDVAREAFDRQQPAWLVARWRRREWAIETGRVLPIELLPILGAAALAKAASQRVELACTKRNLYQLAGIIEAGIAAAEPAGKWASQ